MLFFFIPMVHSGNKNGIIILMNTLSTLIILASIVVLLITSAWFAGTETALTSLTSLQIAQMRKKRCKNVKFVLKIKKQMEKTLVTILIGNNIVNILLSALVALFANSLFNAIGVSIALGIVTFLIIVFGDIIPKSRAIALNDDIVARNAKVVYYMVIIFKPLVNAFISLSNYLLKKYGIKKSAAAVLVNEQKIMDLVTLGLHEGTIDELENDIIRKLFRFSDIKCYRAMLPIRYVFTVNQTDKLSKIKTQIATRGFTRVPVKDKNNKIVGLIHAKDLLDYKGESLKGLVRPALMVKSTDLISKAFNFMKQESNHMVVVVGKSGKHIGVITLEDIIEELFGDIYDEYKAKKYK
ncbi:DUF21 domain-containing protein [Candidatus Peregrinibacteria bacterium]|nr:DUF21 domain-containing protein [Candidatus Peregrinibacteria bacterium]